ncbi:RagB/SusD family nutrient uptake outer membrane protein [Parapedobacter sp. DT-150]|uniref:RagB/SusD family nutrient uptake outer membrane protein n=1 Tax=Parapedobacter sp. DT-150 TaxID=3396162 RepID=UPI003F1BB00F
MKKIAIAITVCAITAVSCSNFLDLAPEYEVNDQNFYSDKNDFEALIMGCYSGLQTLHNNAYPFLAELTTDNVHITLQSPGVNELECDEMNITSSNAYVSTLWSSSFVTIARANSVLNRIDDAEMSDADKNQYRGEAYFIRAYCYFNLVRLYGDVPLVTKDFRSPDEVQLQEMTRQPVERIDSLIVSDLSNADVLLANVSLSKGRGSSGAAKALLGKFFLTRKDFPNARTYLQEVVDSKQYELVDDYGSLFSPTNDDLIESIFEIKYLSGNVGEGNSFAQQEVPVLYGGMALFPGNQLGGGRLSPTLDLVNAYEDGDRRKDLSISEDIPLNDGSIYKLWYGKKFVDFNANPVSDMDNNFTVLRYADVLLMLSEALNESGEGELAADYLNEVRQRAGLADVGPVSKQDLALALERERRVEFLFEGQRWFDLVRTGRAKQVLNDYYAAAGLNFSVEDHELLMPIPQNERDINPGLTQNEGY